MGIFSVSMRVCVFISQFTKASDGLDQNNKVRADDRLEQIIMKEVLRPRSIYLASEQVMGLYLSV